VIKHKINIQHDYDDMLCENNISIIERAVSETLLHQGTNMLCVVNVLITDDKTIREYNRDYRGIDKPTDVLSFPMQAFPQAGWKSLQNPELDEDTGDLPLGDIIISGITLTKQAKQYGNSVDYEAAYLTIHSTLHLLGYEHSTDESEKIMHSENEAIMKEMGFNIND